jgi:hypothetical protein
MYLKDTNESLTRIGPRTPMGDLLRHFWVPALFEHELPKYGMGEPIDVRLFGEDLVAEVSGGKIALTDRYFKEMEPYPAVANGGIVWAYLGPKEFKPQLPAFAWLALPPIKRSNANRIEPCNWAYALEASLAAPTQPIFMPPFYTTAAPDHAHAFVPVDDTHTCIWTFGANAHPDVEEPGGLVGNDAIMDFQHRMILLARDNARGKAPDAASHGDWYVVRPFPV